MKLFPHILIRVAGGSFDKLESLNLCESIQRIHEITSLKKKLNIIKEEICDALFHLISTKTKSELCGPLINLKRDIFNERNISKNTLSFLKTHISRDTYNNIVQYLNLKKGAADLQAEGSEIFARELHVARDHLCDLIQMENMQKGLLLSSQSLLKNGLPNYLKKNKESLKKKDLKTEHSLIKYVSRIYAKTSPFSTFTNLAMGGLNHRPGAHSPDKEDGSVFAVDSDQKPRVISHIRLNNYLYMYLKNLLLKNKDIFRWFFLRLNPTLKKDNGRYLYLINSNNIESFQRIDVNPVLELLFDICSGQNEGVIYHDLVQTIVKNDYIDAGKDDIENYLNQLIEYGFLEFNIGVSGIDPDWDLKLCEILTPIKENIPLISEVLDTLKLTRKLSEQYAKTDVGERRTILKEAYHRFKSMAMKLHEAAGLPPEEREEKDLSRKKEIEKNIDSKEDSKTSDKENGKEESPVFKQGSTTRFWFKPEQMFYEDTVLNATLCFDKEKLIELIKTLHLVYRELFMFEGHRDQQDEMAHYFIQKYGSEKKLDLLTFYEDYYREIKKPAAKRAAARKQLDEKDRKKTKKENETDLVEDNNKPFIVPGIEERTKQIKKWQKQLESVIQEIRTDTMGPINIKYEQIKKITAIFNTEQNDPNKKKSVSRGIFVQLFHEYDEGGRPVLKGVLNSSLPGFGKMISRFLYLFDDQLSHDVRQWNRSLERNDIFMENCDASYFNANLHPPLMPFEIWIPNGNNSLPAQKQIPVTELEVFFDSETGQLQLWHKPTQKRAYTFNLGFQNMYGRSQLFNLLENFSLTEYLGMYPILSVFNKVCLGSPKEYPIKIKKILKIPRILVEDHLIIQRETWYIPMQQIPFRKHDEENWIYFSRLNQWRLENGMPDEIFVYVAGSHLQQFGNENKKANRNMGKDDYKPQYICFKNPFLVNLFEKLTRKVTTVLKIEEMLPHSKQLSKIDQKRYVTEFVIQWYDQSKRNEYQ